jgi:hypothetical protein
MRFSLDASPFCLRLDTAQYLLRKQSASANIHSQWIGYHPNLHETTLEVSAQQLQPVDSKAMVRTS